MSSYDQARRFVNDRERPEGEAPRSRPLPGAAEMADLTRAAAAVYEETRELLRERDALAAALAGVNERNAALAAALDDAYDTERSWRAAYLEVMAERDEARRDEQNAEAVLFDRDDQLRHARWERDEARRWARYYASFFWGHPVPEECAGCGGLEDPEWLESPR